jgi:hypothetical protein
VTSRKKQLTEKATKVQLKVRFTSLLKDPKTGKLKVEDCVITFGRQVDLNEYEKKFEEAISSQK